MAVLSNSAAAAFVNRNPRYVMLLGFVLVCSTLLLLPWHSTPLQSLQGYIPSKFRGHMSLEEFVRQEEVYYADMLSARAEMIKDYGPTTDKVDPFPPGNIYHTMWDYFIPAFNCPHRVQRVGSLGDGGKWVCGVQRLAAQRAPCVVYSLGVNHDSSFEAALLTAAPNCEVWGYDFSVTTFGPEVHNNPTFAAKSHFAPYKIGAHDNAHLNPPEYTIQTLLERNGHRFIDLLKVDIEGAEFEALTAFLKPYLTPGGPSLPIGQLEIEIHVWGANSNFQSFHHWWSLMEKAGLRPFFTEPNLPHVSHLRTRPDVVEYSLLNIRGRHALVSEDY